MARMKFICDAERCIEMQQLRHCLQERTRGALGREPAPRGDDQRRHSQRREVHLGGLHALLRTRPAWPSARWTASTGPTTAWCCTTRTSASAAATAPTPAPSAPCSSSARAPSACAARWTSARSAPGARRRTAARKNSRSTAATGWPRASCRSAPKCARPRRCSAAMAT